MFRRLWVKVFLAVVLASLLRLVLLLTMLGPPPGVHGDATSARPIGGSFLRIVIGIELGTTLLLSLLVAVPLVRRVQRLARETRAVLDDDLRGQVPDGVDELGQLGRAFNEASRAARARLDEERQRDERIRTALVDLAHDVRTPLASIKLGIGRLIAEPGSDVASFTLRAEVEHLDRLFSNVATAIQLGGSTIPLERRPLDVGEVVERLVARYRLLADGRGIAVHLHRSTDSLLASVDPIAFEQAVGNLVDNAVKFARANAAVLAFARDGGVVVQVRDDGPGFDDGEVRNLAERGYRGRGASSRGGYGLGLAIASEIASRHGGSLSLASHPEGGAQAEIVLPRDPAGC